MLKRHILGLAAVLSLALPAAASLGPEVPLSPEPALGPAAYDQNSPAAASNGRDFLVAWNDNAVYAPSIRAVRVGADGTPANRLSRRIAANANSPKVAAVGSDYLMVWRSDSVRALRVDGDGSPLAAEHEAAPWSVPFALVSNGSTALLLTINNPNGFTQNITAILLDRNGNPLRTLYTGRNMPLAAGVHDGRYVIVDVATDCGSGGCRYSPFLRTLGEDGTAAEVPLPVISAPTNLMLCAALSPQAIFLGWHAWSSSPITAGYVVGGFDGQPVRPPAAIEPDQFTDSFAPAAGWDGHQFLFVFSGVAFTTRAIRVAADGTNLDQVPLMLSSKPGIAPVFASNGTEQLLVWGSRFSSVGGDIVGRSVPDFDAVARASDQFTLISYSGAAQTFVHLARSAGSVLAVWSDERNQRISGALNGHPIAIAEAQSGWVVELPVVAAGSHAFLVTWMQESGSTGQLLAKRFDFDGRDLDPQPVVLGTAAPQLDPLNSATLAFDGSAFLAAWPNGQDLDTVKIGEEGAPFDARQNVAVTISAKVHSPRALWTGAGFFIGYSIERIVPVDPSTPIPAAISALKIGTAVASEQAPPLLFDNIGSRRVPVAAALGADDRVTFAWLTYCGNGPCVAVAQSTREGAPLLTARFAAPLPFYSLATSADIAWDGSAFVVVWTEWSPAESWKLRGIHVSRTGTPIESEPFEISSEVAGWLPPAVIGTPTGAVVAYSRIDDASGGAPRAFMRAINRFSPPPPRRRVAGR